MSLFLLSCILVVRLANEPERKVRIVLMVADFTEALLVPIADENRANSVIGGGGAISQRSDQKFPKHSSSSTHIMYFNYENLYLQYLEPFPEIKIFENSR